MRNNNYKKHKTTCTARQLSIDELEKQYAKISSSLSEIQHVPKLLVFDLDNTVWTPELYQIRQPGVPKIYDEIGIFDDVQAILYFLSCIQDDERLRELFSSTKLAIASRTNKVKIAGKLLRQFELPTNVGKLSLASLFDYSKVFPGSKRQHFSELRDESGVPLSEMLFFDDDAKMNLGEISSMGVLCCHTPRGLKTDEFITALVKYNDMKLEDSHQWMGETVSVVNNNRDDFKTTTQQGSVKFFSDAKRFGFVKDEGGKEYFFHESKVVAGLQLLTGMKVEFETSVDSQGRPSAAITKSLEEDERGSSNNKSLLPCFSMSQPFASLLVNGIKTVETRNNPMFMNVQPGTKILLHAGMRDWRDQEAPRVELRKAGFTEREIKELSALPNGFSKGNIIGVLTVGRTWLATDRERRSSKMERKVVAKYEDMGKYCTEITSAEWLEKAISIKGQPGIFNVKVPSSDTFWKKEPKEYDDSSKFQSVWSSEDL